MGAKHRILLGEMAGEIAAALRLTTLTMSIVAWAAFLAWALVVWVEWSTLSVPVRWLG